MVFRVRRCKRYPLPSRWWSRLPFPLFLQMPWLSRVAFPSQSYRQSVPRPWDRASSRLKKEWCVSLSNYLIVCKVTKKIWHLFTHMFQIIVWLKQKRKMKNEKPASKRVQRKNLFLLCRARAGSAKPNASKQVQRKNLFLLCRVWAGSAKPMKNGNGSQRTHYRGRRFHTSAATTYLNRRKTLKAHRIFYKSVTAYSPDVRERQLLKGLL